MRTILVIAFICLLSVAGIANRAEAAATQWQDLGGGKARLLALADPATGSVTAIVEVELEKGWKTYWREPSGSGIPPTFDFSRSRGYAFDEPRFPVPHYLEAGGARFAGYKNTVRFLIEGRAISSGGNGEIGLDVMIGVCEEICIPATAAFTLSHADLMQSDFQAAQAVSAAREELPSPDSASLQITGLSRIDDLTLRVEAAVPEEAASAELFAEAPRDWYVTAARLVSIDDGIALFELPAEKGGKAAEGQARFRLTLSSGGEAVEQWRTLEAE